MSVLIKGMEMPKDCRECRLKYYSFSAGDTWCEVNYAILAKSFKAIEFDGKPDSCPLVEVPTPHGALIDADALIANHFSNEHRIALSYANKVWMRKIITDEPTVIEAEEKG